MYDCKITVTQACKELAKELGGYLFCLWGFFCICYRDPETESTYFVPEMTDEELEKILTSSNPLETIYQWQKLAKCPEGMLM